MSKIAECKLQRKKERKLAWLLIIVGLLAFVSYLYASRQYNLTIIPFKYIIFIAITSGLLCGGLTYRYKEKVEGKAFKTLKHFIWTILIYGCISCALFLFLNRQFKKTDTYTVKAQILERHDHYKSSPRHVTVEINGVSKDVNFPNTEMAVINKSSFVILKLHNGAFNFPIIENNILATR